MSVFQKISFTKHCIGLLAALGISALTVPAMGTEAAEIVSEGPAILYAAEESVNMSSGPGDTFQPISSVPYGTPIQVDAMADNGWYRVSSTGGAAWVDGADCTVDDPLILTEGCRLIPGTGAGASSATEAKALFDTIPDPLKPLFSGIDIYLDRNRLRENYVGNNDVNQLAGIYVYGKEIDIDAEYVGSALLHECGHHIDYVIGEKYKIGKTFGLYQGVYMLSYTDEFLKIFNLEAQPSGLIAAHPNKEPAEYFASAFEKYVENPAGLLQSAPLTYMYICRLTGDA